MPVLGGVVGVIPPPVVGGVGVVGGVVAGGGVVVGGGVVAAGQKFV